MGNLIDDLRAIVQEIESVLGVRLTEEDFAHGREEIRHVFLHEACHAAVSNVAPWIHELDDRDHTAVDEIMARLLEKRIGSSVGLLAPTPEEQVRELARYPVRITVEKYEDLRREWRKRYWPVRDVQGMAAYALSYLREEGMASERRDPVESAGTGMSHQEVGRYWDENADVWTRLSRAGYDTYRDHVNTPAFFEMLPDVDGLSGLDVGCGEGYNTRLLTRRGARVTALDISERFLRHARELEQQEPLGIDYHIASGVHLPYGDEAFDFVTAFMSFMDMPQVERVMAEAHRVLKHGGFLQFSITHPCFHTPHWRRVRDQRGVTCAMEVGDYFRNLEGVVEEWLPSAVPREILEGIPPFRVPRFTRTLSQWLNLLLETGFQVEWVQEPRPDDETVRRYPNLQDARVVAYFLQVRARKPEARKPSAGPAAIDGTIQGVEV